MDKKISVLMGIYNCEKTLKQSVMSIINQTYENWELIMCDDGSTDSTFYIANELKKLDKRIILIKNDRNLGLNYTLNNCFKHSSGEYIARMDADDDCLPTRFEKQMSFLENNLQYSIVSTPMIFFDENGEWGQTKRIEKPTKKDVVIGSPICHAPVMMRRECLEAVDGYSVDKKKLRVEDVDLWIKLYACGFCCYNLSEPLYRMRNDQKALQRRKYRYRINSTMVRLNGCKKLHLGISCYLYSFKPMIIGLIPANLRDFLKRKMSK